MDGSDSIVPSDIWGAARDAVTEGLRDPYSTQFDHLKVVSSKGSTICGRFNAKNQAGGYDGFKPFEFDSASKSLTVNQTNECGKETVDKAAHDRLMAECNETTTQLTRYAAGQPFDGNPSDLLAKGKWCQTWLRAQIDAELNQLSGN